MFSLKGKNAFVTGGTSGIGLAVAQNYVENGATVVIAGRRDTTCDIAREIGATGMQLDVTDEAAVIDALAEIEETIGKLDIVVANAGIAEDVGTMADSESDYMRRCVDVNLMGVYYCLKHSPQHMNEAGGSIIITGSAAGSGVTMPGYGEYAASKAGAAYLGRTAGIELGPVRNIRVNVVAPGSILGTGMLPDGVPEVDLMYSTVTALGRTGRVDEVTGLYNFLASDASSWITGQEIRIDGGITAGITLPTMEKIMAGSEEH